MLDEYYSVLGVRKGADFKNIQSAYKQIMAEFEAPPMNGDHQEDLRRFVARRKQEGGAPTDF